MLHVDLQKQQVAGHDGHSHKQRHHSCRPAGVLDGQRKQLMECLHGVTRGKVASQLQQNQGCKTESSFK